MRYLLCALVLFLPLPVASAQVWTLSGPSSRHSHTAVFDSVSKQMIIFGGQQTTTGAGLNDLWFGSISTNESDNFTQVSANGSLPPGRYGHVAAYDSTTNRMMVFSGALGSPGPCAKDFWLLDSANGRSGRPTWSSQSPSGTPPAARAYAASAYDPGTNSLIVFGGSNCSNSHFNDVWILSGANGEQGTPKWAHLTTSGVAPSKRESAVAIYDPSTNVFTLFGGDAGGNPFSDVWTLSHANASGGTAVWTKLVPTGTPPRGRTGHTAIYDSANNRMIIFGGVNKTTTLADSWALTAANGVGSPSWVQVKTSGTAPSLAYHTAVYDAALGYMYAFAGSSSADKLSSNSHAFTLTGANGLSQKPARWILGGPPVRYAQSAFYDGATNAVFVFGGQHSRDNLDFNDYWAASNVIGSTNLKWSLIGNSGGAPSARYGHTGLYDSNSNRLMVFAGSTGTCQNDFHILQHANRQGGPPMWSTVTPMGNLPAPRVFQAAVYDQTSNTLIVFGGFDCTASYFNDVWILSNANSAIGQPTWTLLNTAGTPPDVRESSTAVYDSATNSLIIYGGDQGADPLGDLWVLSHANGAGGTPTWSQRIPLNDGPVARSGHTATYDPVQNLMTIYGGFDGQNVLSDVWVLTGANGIGTMAWMQGVSGQPRRFHSSMYDPNSKEIITFGGSSSLNPLVPSSDVYTLSGASQQR